jgi:hypothetical protein
MRGHDGGNTIQSQGHCEGLRGLPLKAMECARAFRQCPQHWAEAPISNRRPRRCREGLENVTLLGFSHVGANA